MKNKANMASVRRSPFASIVVIIALFALLAFFLFFIGIGSNMQGMGGVIGVFLIIWVLLVIGGIIYHIANLNTFSKSSKEKIPVTAEEVISIFPEHDEVEEKPGSMAFDVKLRKLEELRNNKLITEKEYQQKRKEVMKEKW